MFATAGVRMLLYVMVTCTLASLLAFAAFSSSASADHSWGNFHWANSKDADLDKKPDEFTLKLDDNVSSTWDSNLATASSDWSQSSVLDTQRNIVADAGSPKSCKATSGRVEVCNARYGNSGWLGLAQIWARGSHIIRGSVKMNDFYSEFSDGNNPDGDNSNAWRQSVLCEEVGHTLGLDHQDEDNFNDNLGSCMDYTEDPDGTLANPDQLSNLQPNAHDYEQLELIYAHLDGTTTVSSAAAVSKMPPAARQGGFNSKAEWGRKIRESRDGDRELWKRSFGDGFKLITWVIRP